MRPVWALWLGANLIAAQAWAAGAPKVPTHCAADEQQLFSCPAGKKVISVCQGSGLPQYRFGRPGAIEIELPGAASQAGVSLGSMSYSGGGAVYLRFAKGEMSYVVFSGGAKGWFKEGVAVQKQGHTIAKVKCQELAQSRITPDLPGIPADTQGFDIP